MLDTSRGGKSAGRLGFDGNKRDGATELDGRGPVVQCRACWLGPLQLEEHATIMEQFIIDGGYALRGTVTPAGNKNAALPVLAACLLTREPVILRNLPQIRDVTSMREILTLLGTRVETLDDHSWRLHTPELSNPQLDPELCRRIRASLLVAGPMLARHGQINLPLPGGDVIGRR